MQSVGGATELMYACQQCMENEVLDLIRKQPNSVKDRDRTSKTTLHYCAENPNTSCAEVVLRAAPELVNAQDDNGYSTLHLAVIAGNKALIKLLITKGADVNVHDNEGHSAVHWAIVSSEKEALEMIIRAGANPSTPDIHGGYPLHYAVQMCGSNCDYIKSLEDAVRVVETLLNFGVDVNVKDKDSRQPILWAASAGSPEAVIHLVSSGACVEASDKDGLTALHCAASRGHTATLETLISLCGANVDVIDGNGCSALFYSVTLGHADATELLLQLGAEPNRQDRKGRTPAHCGAAKGQIETLRILQKHGGNLWLRNVKGDIPLHEAVASGRKDLVLWLLSQNPEAINIANNDGRCPLHIASMYNNTEMVKVLLDSKSLVNPIMRTSKGVLMTPLNVALCKGHRSCGKYLQLHGGVPFSKVARLEPASVFAVRVSPSDEMMLKCVETSKETLSGSQSKISKSRTSAEIQGSQESDKAETAEKKKVYRRRKKKKSASSFPTQDSDSEESIQDLKVKTLESRKVKKSNRVNVDAKDNSHESMKVEKVRSVTKDVKMEQNSKKISAANSQTDSSREAVEISQETVIAEKVTKTAEEVTKVTKVTLQTNKSFNETKNVSDLSPEDFPPLMQTINQLDLVMMEPDIEESKDDDCDKSLKVQNATTLGSESVGLTREREVVAEGNDQEYRLETVSVDTLSNVSNGIEAKEDKVGKVAVPAQEKSVKTADDQKDDAETKSDESKSLDSTGENGPHRKTVKSPKTSNNSSSGKKEDRFLKNEKTSSANSSGSEKHKKAVRPKSPKTAVADQAKAIRKPRDTSVVEKKYGEKEKVLNSERKVDEIKENENEKSKAETDTNDLSDGIVLKEETQSNLGNSPEVMNPERVSDMESANGKDDMDSSKGDEKEKDSTVDPNNSAQLSVLESLETPIPKEESETVAGDENIDVTETGKKETYLNPPEENAIKDSDEIETSVSVQPSDCGRAENVEEHTSEMLPSETLPAHNTTGNSSLNDAELPVSETRDETNEGDSHNAAEQEFADPEISNEKREECPVVAVEQAEDVKPEDDVAKEGDDEVHEVRNEESVLENGEFRDSVSSRKNDHEQKAPKVTRVSRLCRRQRDFKGSVNEMSVTQLVQNTLRKYHMERGIFYQLLELKRYQIRSGRANEQVLVKRLADEYERSRVFLGMKPFSGVYKFREFEKFLYDQLRALNARRSFLIPEMKSYDDIDTMSSFLKKSRYKMINDISQPEMACTCITQRCHHSACAYTSVPCSGYITDLRRLKCHKPRREGLFPRIEQPPLRSDTERVAPRPSTLELIQGTEKHVITLPQNSPEKGKRYYVTFTIKSAPVFKEEDLVADSKPFAKHRHAKSV